MCLPPMSWRTFFSPSPDSLELLQSTARNLIYTLAGLYTALHIIATLGWPQIFSPSLWLISLSMVLLVYLVLRLLPRHYLLAQSLWLSGLGGLIWMAYRLYGKPETLLLWAILPLIAAVTLGERGALGITLLLSAAAVILPGGSSRIAIFLAVWFALVFGWGISRNLLSALDSASYHYRQTRKLLEETRQHRARISRMLKEQNQANYQLERLNQMLQSARRQAEAARDERDRFILAVSHELRSPLNFIIGFSDLMVKSPETYAPLSAWPPGLHEDVQEIYRSSTHLLGLINDILDLGKIDAHHMLLYREESRLEEVIAEVTAMTRPAIEKKGLFLRVEVPDNLPTVFIDRTRIRQVLLNLLTNAMRFTEQGGITLEVTRQAQHIVIAVQDTGHGIAPEDLPKVFHPFRQVGESNWKRREGTGLGLPISRRFVELHGGEMRVESQVGTGTRFWFTLPIMARAIPENPAIRPLPGPQERPLFLLCSSDPAARQFIQQAIPECEVIQETEAANLPKLAQQYYPRALLVESTHPQPIPSMPYDLPILYFHQPGNPPAASMPHGIHAYLVKPVLPAHLLAVLETDMRHLLVVDDDPAMLRFLQQTLRAPQPSGSPIRRLTTTQSGAQALEIAAAHPPPDALLLDLELPDMDGWALLEALRAIPGWERVPVIVISAADAPQAPPDNRRKVLELHLRRALSSEELGAAMRLLLDHIPPQYPLHPSRGKITTPQSAPEQRANPDG